MRRIKKTGQQSWEERFYLSSQNWRDRTPEQWINLVRSHWAGVENRNHYRRDASLGEDGSRTRNPNALANLALLRNCCLLLFSRHAASEARLPAHTESCAAVPSIAIKLILERLSTQKEKPCA